MAPQITDVNPISVGSLVIFIYRAKGSSPGLAGKDRRGPHLEIGQSSINGRSAQTCAQQARSFLEWPPQALVLELQLEARPDGLIAVNVRARRCIGGGAGERPFARPRERRKPADGGRFRLAEELGGCGEVRGGSFVTDGYLAQKTVVKANPAGSDSGPD